jgi:hypothetical protein
LTAVPEEHISLGRLIIDGRIILKLTSRKYGVTMWVGFTRIKIGSSSGLV